VVAQGAGVNPARPAKAAVRVGIGGWVYDEWRNNFYPAGWPRSRELEYASQRLGTIEINSTFYGAQKPATFAKWRDATPDDFVFSVKATRFATHRRVLAEAGESVERFIGSGLSELGPKLGPIVWQFAPTHRFEAGDFEAFLALLPAAVDGLVLRHVLDVRHPSFMCAEYLALARRHAMATVFADSDEHPSFANLTGDFVYARLMRCVAEEPQGYSAAALTRWAECASMWQQGGEPAGLSHVDEAQTAAATAAAAKPRDVFMFFISGAKERAPHAAMGLIERIK
jgi:uncharacterized protein YecE (DUF72 family)